MYNKTTENVSVTVDPVFLKEGSKPEEGVYLWAYHVRIENKRPEPIYLRRRYWHITDSMGYVQEVKGVGVIGEQPCILADSIYEYASGTILTAPSGLMVGNYEMELENKEIFLVEIPPFSLDSPYESVKSH